MKVIKAFFIAIALLASVLAAVSIIVFTKGVALLLAFFGLLWYAAYMAFCGAT